MKLRTAISFLLMLILTAGSFGSISVANAVAHPTEMTMELSAPCDDSCEMSQTSCADDCVSELSCCMQIQTGLYLPAIYQHRPDREADPGWEQSSGYYFSPLKRIDHPPRNLV